ncbi:mercury(II) reductase [Nocardioides massiliensis]|uniref:Mercuric reductase n=1 Tax=Nocardioides massiliensis TaxID=1325935 RepID=A0ABT9NS79_9ACTN|nr:mercury(II) reductase [Nocardioides massiliensis]MDP9823281.1 mercuric reductase [Nocardioides massiliensis]
MTQDLEVDLAVIGSGGAAMAAGIAARKAGASVVLVERGVLGGTCVNVGCVPSKMLLAAAGARHGALTNPFGGAPTSADGVDLAALVGQKSELVGWLRQHKYADVADAWGFPVLTGEARFVDRDTLEVDGKPLRADGYVLATGSQPHTVDIDGIDAVDYLTSTTAMELTEVPESLVVVGGGYVGMEQAQLFAHLGARVTVVGRLAPQAEPELREVMAAVFAEDGITVIEEHAAVVQSAGDGGVTVSTSSGREAAGQRLLVATGRRPDTTALDLAFAGVGTDPRGFVTVDEHQRTTNPKVYAAGDVAGTPQYVYVAAAAGRVAATNALAPEGSRPASVDYTGLPAVMFTRPQLASAGLTEEQAIADGHACTCRVLGLGDVPRALVNHDTRGAVKLVADAETGKVLGVHAVADGAGEMMLAATYAIKAGMTVDDLADTWAPYLTMAESLRLTAGLFRDEMPTSCCA